MKVIEEHTSPDGVLRLVVTLGDDGDTTIGFDGYGWHTHGDLLASLADLPESEAIRQFIERLTLDDAIIAVSLADGRIIDVWLTDDPQADLRSKPPEESLAFRRWSGLAVEVE